MPIGTTNPTTRACALCFPQESFGFSGSAFNGKQEEEEEDKDKEEEEGRARASRRVDVQNLCRFFSREECGQKEALFFYFTNNTIYTRKNFKTPPVDKTPHGHNATASKSNKEEPTILHFRICPGSIR